MNTLPNDYQNFIALSRYARWLPEKNRRETWQETVARYFDFMEEHLKENTNQELVPKTRKILEEAVLNLDVMPSMRALMTSGKALKDNNIAGYNCAYLSVDHPKAFDECLYVLMHGTGVGFSVERQSVNKLPEVPEEMIDVIYNPIDSDKFKPKPTVKTENSVLFVGTIDYLRKESILDLMERTKEEGKELWLVGEDKSNYLQQVLVEPHVKHFPPTWAVENFIYRCEETAGIQLGRTTIEGWMCGKPSWIYKVDSGGFILSKERFEPPTDVEKYFASNVAKQIKEEYQKVL